MDFVCVCVSTAFHRIPSMICRRQISITSYFPPSYFYFVFVCLFVCASVFVFVCACLWSSRFVLREVIESLFFFFLRVVFIQFFVLFLRSRAPSSLFVGNFAYQFRSSCEMRRKENMKAILPFACVRTRTGMSLCFLKPSPGRCRCVLDPLFSPL